MMKTHDDYWEAKRQVARLTDSKHRGIAGEVAIEQLDKYTEEIAEWEQAHPILPEYQALHQGEGK